MTTAASATSVCVCVSLSACGLWHESARSTDDDDDNNNEWKQRKKKRTRDNFWIFRERAWASWQRHQCKRLLFRSRCVKCHLNCCDNVWHVTSLHQKWLHFHSTLFSVPLFVRFFFVFVFYVFRDGHREMVGCDFSFQIKKSLIASDAAAAVWQVKTD